MFCFSIYGMVLCSTVWVVVPYLRLSSWWWLEKLIRNEKAHIRPGRTSGGKGDHPQKKGDDRRRGHQWGKHREYPQGKWDTEGPATPRVKRKEGRQHQTADSGVEAAADFTCACSVCPSSWSESDTSSTTPSISATLCNRASCVRKAFVWDVRPHNKTCCSENLCFLLQFHSTQKNKLI